MDNFFFPLSSVYCKVQPIAFDGTLSFLELVEKLIHYVNELNTEIEGKQDQLTFDPTPTANSTNPVTSGGIKTYVDDVTQNLDSFLSAQIAAKQDALTFDTTPTANSTNPVTSGGIKTYVDSGLNEKQNTLTFDTTPTANSTNPVTSDGIYEALQNVETSSHVVIYTAALEDRNIIVRSLSGAVVTGNSAIINLTRANPSTMYILYKPNGDNTEIEVFRVLGYTYTGTTPNIVFASRYHLLTGTNTQAWTISNRWSSTVAMNDNTPATSGAVFNALQPYANAKWTNIEVDLSNGSYSSITTYAEINAVIENLEVAPPFVSVYDEDEMGRTAILYYAGKDQNGIIYFSNTLIPHNAAYAPDQLILGVNSSNVWTSYNI